MVMLCNTLRLSVNMSWLCKPGSGLLKLACFLKGTGGKKLKSIIP